MSNLPEEGITNRRHSLTTAIEELLPDFAKSCRDTPGVVVLHQDAFAADYQDDEYKLLGMAIKFAGLYGKEIRIVGKNRETVTQPRIN
jgi:hypothetical protein